MPGDSKPYLVAALSQGALAIYLQLIEWVPMPPWNDLSRGNGQESLDIILGVLMLALIAGTLARFRWALGVAVLGLVAWFALQVQTWWIPYFTGGTPQWQRVYAKWFANNVRILPDWSDHPVPDAAHTLLHIFIVLALWASWRAWRNSARNA